MNGHSLRQDRASSFEIFDKVHNLLAFSVYMNTKLTHEHYFSAHH